MLPLGQAATVSGLRGYDIMNEYILPNDDERANNYYMIMGGLEVRSLSEKAIIASSYIKNIRIKNDFRNNITLFIEGQKDILEGNTTPTQKLQAITYLKQENSYLSDQIFKIKFNKALKVISIVIDILGKELDEPVYYFFRGVGIVSGFLQVEAGLGLIGGSYLTGPGAVI